AGSASLVVAALAVPALFSVLPLVVLAANSVGVGLAPADTGLTLDHYAAAFASAGVREALANSALIALGSVIGAVLMTVPIALELAHAERSGARRLRTALTDAVLTLPIALPGIVIGFFAIVLVGRTGLFALVWSDVAGLAYTFVGMLVAYVYFTLPRVMGPLRGAAAALAPALSETAMTLGASRTRAFWTITLPPLLPAIVRASGTAAAVALGGYGTVATLSEGVRLLPLNVVNALTTGYRLADSSALAVILALVATLALLGGHGAERLVRWAVSRA
ncbi:MAG: ABC transporter permease subunit, partial [Microbacterium sp.]